MNSSQGMSKSHGLIWRREREDIRLTFLGKNLDTSDQRRRDINFHYETSLELIRRKNNNNKTRFVERSIYKIYDGNMRIGL